MLGFSLSLIKRLKEEGGRERCEIKITNKAQFVEKVTRVGLEPTPLSRTQLCPSTRVRKSFKIS